MIESERRVNWYCRMQIGNGLPCLETNAGDSLSRFASGNNRQPAPIAVQDVSRAPAITNEFGWTIDIRQYGLEQSSALDEPGL